MFLNSPDDIEYRELTTARGDVFRVPIFIERFDDASLTGWQLRYGAWTDYPDTRPDQTGAAQALEKAMADMQFRVETLGK